jgi:hypothetical protein
MSQIKEYFAEEIDANYRRQHMSRLTPMAEVEQFFSNVYAQIGEDKIPQGYIRYMDGRLEKVEL